MKSCLLIAALAISSLVFAGNGLNCHILIQETGKTKKELVTDDEFLDYRGSKLTQEGEAYYEHKKEGKGRYLVERKDGTWKMVFRSNNFEFLGEMDGQKMFTNSEYSSKNFSFSFDVETMPNGGNKLSITSSVEVNGKTVQRVVTGENSGGISYMFNPDAEASDPIDTTATLTCKK